MGKIFTQTQKAGCCRGRTLYSLISFWQVGDSSRQAYSTINHHKAVAGCYSLFAKSFPSVPTAPTFFRASSMRLKKTARTLILQLATSLVPSLSSVRNRTSIKPRPAFSKNSFKECLLKIIQHHICTALSRCKVLCKYTVAWGFGVAEVEVGGGAWRYVQFPLWERKNPAT